MPVWITSRPGWIAKRIILFGVTAAVCVLLFNRFEGSASGGAPGAFQDAELFEKKIRPILVGKCQKCHNPQAQVAMLDLTTSDGFIKGGESGPIVDKEHPANSRLIKVISYTESIKMPPTGRLSVEEIADLTAWVSAGAPWPGTPPSGGGRQSPSTVRQFTEEEKKYWAFQPLLKISPPAVRDEAWIQSPIDRFILSKLEEKGLKPAPAADRLTLLRRATYDLTGLPPTEKEQQAFLADSSRDAFAKVVERLLASERYGEKWGRHWLDVARYADSTGNDEDHRYPHAWRYRDYVIQSFNHDLPYNQFVRQQLAGDLIPAADPATPNRTGIVATGFLALGAKAIAQQDKKKMLYDVYDEQVDVTSKAFLGLTLACARCHNHKFDPLLTRDYYSMTGIFASTRSFLDPASRVSAPLELPLVPAAEYQKYKDARKASAERLNRIRLAIEEVTDSVREALVSRDGNRIAEYMCAAHQVYAGSAAMEAVASKTGLSGKQLAKWVELLKPSDTVRGYLREWYDATPDNLTRVASAYQDRFLKRLNEWRARIDAWKPGYEKAVRENSARPEKPRFEAGEDRFFGDLYFDGGPFTISQKEKDSFSAQQLATLDILNKDADQVKAAAPVEPEMACAVEDGDPVRQPVFVRGDYNNPGEDAPKAFPSILVSGSPGAGFKGSGRLELANWLTDPANPLPPRVMVNRIWLWHFGEGIVRTPDNFGRMGDRPSHPELLDFLAQEFIGTGYSIKAMHRLLMLSSTYQMSSTNRQANEVDPDNRLLARFNPRRLTIEEIRDGLLAIDGSIDFTMGGSLQTGRGTDGENNQGRLSLNPEKLTRRTVYLPLRRANLPTILNLFDFGDATLMQGKRQLTNVPTQALFWLNSEFLAERADGLAKLVWGTQTLGGNAEKVARAYVIVLNRKAAPEEIDAGLRHLESMRKLFPGEHSERRSWQSFCRVLMASNDFAYLD